MREQGTSKVSVAFLILPQTSAVAITLFYSTIRFLKIFNLILVASTNRLNTGGGAFHRRESIKHIIRLFSKAV